MWENENNEIQNKLKIYHSSIKRKKKKKTKDLPLVMIVQVLFGDNPLENLFI